MSTAKLRFTRRGFLAGAAALSAPMIIPRHVLGDEKNLPANEKIALGLIGIGKMMYGDHLPHYLKMREVKVVAVCDVDTMVPHGRQRNAWTRPTEATTASAAYANYHEILARPDIDAVACATPDHWHAIIILEACKAGKDIYCEKPLLTNLVEAKTVMTRPSIEDHLPDGQPAAHGPRIPLRLRSPQRPARPDQAGPSRRGRTS